MLQLALSLLLMYIAVGAAAVWYRRQMAARTDAVATANQPRTEGTN